MSSLADHGTGGGSFALPNRCNDPEAILACLRMRGGWVALSKLQTLSLLPSSSPGSWVLQRLVKEGKIEVRQRGQGASARAL